MSSKITRSNINSNLMLRSQKKVKKKNLMSLMPSTVKDRRCKLCFKHDVNLEFEASQGRYQMDGDNLFNNKNKKLFVIYYFFMSSNHPRLLIVRTCLRWTIWISYLVLSTFQFLVDTVQQDPLISEDPACRELIREAVLYHLVPERRSEIQSNRTRPRQSTLENIYVLGGADLNKGEFRSPV